MVIYTTGLQQDSPLVLLSPLRDVHHSGLISTQPSTALGRFSLSTTMAQNTADHKFQDVWKDATRKYEDETKIKFTTHPLARCKNPDAVLDALDRDLQVFQDYRDKKEKLRKWLKPMLHLVVSLSETAGEAAGAVHTAL
jgi:hypothetical protein